MRRRVIIAVKCVVSVSLVLFIYRNTPVDQIAWLVRGINTAYLPVIAGLLFINTLISGAKWQLFLKADDVNIPLWDLLVSYMSGTFCNLFLPSNIGGDSFRIYDIARQSREGVRSAASVFADRLSGFVALALLSFVSALYAAIRFAAPQFLIIPSLLLLLFIAILVLLANPKPVNRLLQFTGLVRFGSLVRVIDKLYISFSRYGADKKLLAKVMLLSFTFQFSVITVVYLMARSLGASTPFLYFSAFVPIITLMEALPISIYGIGVRDYGYVFFFSQVGMGDLQTRSLALLFMATAICYSLIGGLFFLYRLWSGKNKSKHSAEL